jgi:hypothetical protein
MRKPEGQEQEQGKNAKVAKVDAMVAGAGGQNIARNGIAASIYTG